jgi:hypothetical protein
MAPKPSLRRTGLRLKGLTDVFLSPVQAP